MWLAGLAEDHQNALMATDEACISTKSELRTTRLAVMATDEA